MTADGESNHMRHPWRDNLEAVTVAIPDHLTRPEAGIELEIATAVRDLSSEHFGRASGGARRLVAIGEPAVPYLGVVGANNLEIEQHIQIVLRPILRATPALHVGVYLTSPYADVRIAASFICGEQQYTEHTAALVELLEDQDVAVRRAAISALRTLSNRYFGYRADSTESQRHKAIVRWRELWK